jgi:hypothetical protein
MGAVSEELVGSGEIRGLDETNFLNDVPFNGKGGRNKAILGEEDLCDFH